MRMKIRPILLAALAIMATAFAQSADISSAAALAALQARPTGGSVASSSLQRKVDFPTFSIVDSLFRLSPGDQLRLRWWGIGAGDLDLVVDTRGDLVIPDMGRVKAAGIPFRQARDSVEALLRRRTKVTLVDLQIVKVVGAQVRVSGLVPTPGIFDLPPGTRLSTALAQAGLELSVLLQRMQGGDAVWAPLQERLPSLRRVLIIHGDKDSMWCDVVAALRAGDPSQDPPLYYGDRVQVYPRGPLAQVTGGANFAGGMEMVPGESLGSLLHAAGEDSTRKVQVDGVTGPMSAVHVDTTPLLIRFPTTVLRDRPSIAWVVGKVRNPGAFPLKSGTTAKDLVQLAGGVIGGDDSGVVVAVKRGWAWLGAGRSRGLADATQYPEVRVAMLAYFEQMRGTYTDISTPLQAGDTVFVHPAEQVVWVGGVVKRPGFVPWKRGSTVEDYVKVVGGYADRAWDSRTRVFDLQSGLALEAKDADIRPGAAIIVPERRYISPDQWVGIVVSIASLTLTAATFYYTMSAR